MALCVRCRVNEAAEGDTICAACSEKLKKIKEEREQILEETRRRRRLRNLAMQNGQRRH